MPMPAKVGLVVGHYHHMKRAGQDRHLTARAEIGLASRVRLHRRDGHPEKIAHARTAKIATSATTITTTSVMSLS